tara:strand:- start:43 stop:864 length:822 start_codon:yes stop_codon:yes gene_type:complete
MNRTLNNLSRLIILNSIILLVVNSQTLFAQRYYDVSFPMVAFYADSASVNKITPDLTNSFFTSDSIAKFAPITYSGSLHMGSHGFFRGNLYLDDHTGTHIDAPNHFVYKNNDQAKQLSVGELTVDQLTGPMVFLDMSSRKNRNVYPADIEPIVDQLQDGAWLVVNFGLAKHYKTKSYSTIDSPGFAQETCQYLANLIDDKVINITGIGSDNGSTDVTSNFKIPETSCHGILLSKRNILLIESMGSLSEIAKEKGKCELIVAPLKIMGGSGSPA